MSQRIEQAVVVSQAAIDPTAFTTQLALFDVAGAPVSLTPKTGATLLLTGFATGSAVTAVAAADSVNAAIAKLQNRIAALEAA